MMMFKDVDVQKTGLDWTANGHVYTLHCRNRGGHFL